MGGVLMEWCRTRAIPDSIAQRLFLASRLSYALAYTLRAIHITLLAITRLQFDPRDAAEERCHRQLAHQIMGTKPQTLAYALTDSRSA